MPKSNEFANKVKNSSHVSTSAHETSKKHYKANKKVKANRKATVPYEMFETEKNAKNKACYFILSNGFLEEFSKFCKTYYSSDPHKDCLEWLKEALQDK